MRNSLSHIRFEIPSVNTATPVVIIGTGGIVRDAHLPAYQLAGIKVRGVFDLDNTKAETVANQFGVQKVYKTVEQAVAENQNSCIYDLAVPGNQITNVLPLLPDKSFVLMQKPMGENEQQANEILAICQQKRLTAGVNFQLRYAPYILMAKQMMSEGLLGEICDLEIYVNVYTPWHLWDFLKEKERVEILYHSIHYIDLIRNMLGEPVDIFAKTARHPKMKQLQEVKSDIIFDYGEFMRVHISTNHGHGFGLHNQDAFIKIEGTNGAIKIKLGLLMNYPEGIKDKFEYILLDDATPSWKQLPINGSWFPHAFIGSMHEMIKAMNGVIPKPDNAVEDCIHTMQWVEKAYRSRM